LPVRGRFRALQSTMRYQSKIIPVTVADHPARHPQDQAALSAWATQVAHRG
jgi:hypothetical protein